MFKNLTLKHSLKIKNFKFQINLSVVLVCIGSICLFSPTASASSFSLSISPPLIEIVATPPTTTQTNLTVENKGDQTVDLTIALKSFKAKGETGDVSFDTEDTTRILKDRFSILDDGRPITTLSLGPLQKKSLILHFDLDKETPASDYYFSVIFQNTESSQTENTHVGITAGIAANILLSVAPSPETKGNIGEFSTPFFIQKGPIPFHVAVSNTSNHFITPQGYITITNMFGQTIGKVTLLPVHILKKATRFLPDSRLTSLTTAVWPETFLIGPYTATAAIQLSGKGPVFTQTIHFLALPIGIIASIILIAISLGVVIFRVRKRFENRKR